MSAFASELAPNASTLRTSARLALTGASAAARVAVFSEALFSERDVVADGGLGEMLPSNVATVAQTTLESPCDQGNSSGRRKF
jgi:hypothetical protein